MPFTIPGARLTGTITRLLPILLGAVLPAAPLGAQTRPLVDHHQHLFSPATVALVNRKPLPAIQLPPDVAAVVAALERAGTDSLLLRQLYTDDAWLADSTGASWIRGTEAIAGWWGEARPTPLRLVPVGWSAADSAGSLAADLLGERGGRTRPVAHLLLSLRRGGDARWRIAGEAVTAVGPVVDPVSAQDLVAMLDAAGIRRAIVFSMGYTWGSPNRNVEGEYEKVRAENDWTSEQVGRYPDRLRAFCGINPMRDYALAELERCAKDPRLRYGVKLHIGNSVVDYHDSTHIERLRRVFRAANDRGMAIILHARSSFSRRLPYGADEARIFIEQLLPAAPDVPVQVGHLGGAGGWDDAPSEAALAVFADAMRRKDPRTRNLWFDVAAVVTPDIPPAKAAEIAERIRQLGLRRVLYGSDSPTGGNLPPRLGWAAFRLLPLTDAELRTIATNVAPYMR